MKILSIEFKNIGSFGNKLQTIRLDNDSALWLLMGKNGHGKSTLLNLPNYLLYGTSAKYKKEDIANRINKNGYIKGVVEVSNGVKYIIERSFSPSRLTVYDGDGNDINKGSISAYQEFIDNEITKIPYKIFSNTINLSVNDFKSFLTINPSDKRAIVDKIFSTDIVNRLNELNKKEIKTIKYDLDVIQRELLYIDNSISESQMELDKLIKINEDKKKINYDLIQSKYKETTDKKIAVENTLKINNEKYEKVKKAIKLINDKKYNLKNEINNIQKKLDLFNKGKCPLCETDFIDNEYINYTQIKKDLKTAINNKLSDIKAVDDNVIKYVEVENKLRDLIIKLNSGLTKIKTLLREYENSLKDNNSINLSDEENSLNTLIKSNIIKKEDCDKRRKDNIDNLSYYELLEKLYADDGVVKKMIVENYIPLINAELLQTLKILNFPYIIQFDSEFNPILKDGIMDIPIYTLSTGEEKRANIAILVTILRIIKMKYPNLNIFELDEVISTIDLEGIDDILDFLKKTSDELNLNIFIVNHNILPIDYFDYVVYIKKTDGFSDMEFKKSKTC